jgi:hypothetical protein
MTTGRGVLCHSSAALADPARSRARHWNDTKLFPPQSASSGLVTAPASRRYGAFCLDAGVDDMLTRRMPLRFACDRNKR